MTTQKSSPPPSRLALTTTLAAGDATAPCASDLRVFVYEYPGVEAMPWHAEAARMRAECLRAASSASQRGHNRGVQCANHFAGEHLLAQFSLELILHDFFRKSCIRTLDPERADLFFVPHYADVSYRARGRPDEPDEYERALLDIIELSKYDAWESTFNVTSKYWRRRKGADHVLVQAAPVTGLRHPKGRRGWAHYQQQLTRPIWLSLEVSRSFVAEYPHCASKNVVVPYPVPGRAWTDGAWRRRADRLVASYYAQEEEEAASSASSEQQRRKPLFAYCHAGEHGCAGLRKAMRREFSSAPAVRGGVGSPAMVFDHHGGSFSDEDAGTPSAEEDIDAGHSRQRRQRRQLPHTKASRVAKTWTKQAARQALMHLATFCPCPEGDSPSAKRQYDAVLAGCVPVLVSDDALYAFSDFLDEADFSVRVAESVALNGSLLDALRSIPHDSIAKMRANIANDVADAFRYYKAADLPPTTDDETTTSSQLDPLVAGRFPDGGALEYLVKALELRRDGKRGEACRKELGEPHFYLAKQYCGAVPVQSELKKLRAQRTRDARRPERVAVLDTAIAAFEGGRVYRRRRRRRR